MPTSATAANTTDWVTMPPPAKAATAAPSAPRATKPANSATVRTSPIAKTRATAIQKSVTGAPRAESRGNLRDAQRARAGHWSYRVAAVTPDEMRRRVTDARVARLATVRPGGGPHLVPFCYVLDGDTVYSAVDRKPKRTLDLRRLVNAAAEPRVSVLVDHYEDDWSRLWWVRLDGRARRLSPGPEAGRALDALAAKYPQYRAARPPGPVLRIDVERWTAWAAADSG